MFVSALSLIAGFTLLIKGADWLVNGASSIAKKLGLSDLVVGLTVVSFGTSAPELIVNIIASFQGSADIAIGNIVGSNISNTLLILGISAIIAPLAVQRSTVIKEIPFGLLAAITLFVMANDQLVDQAEHSMLTRSDGLAFLGFFVIFLYYTFGIRNNHNGKEEDDGIQVMAIWVSILLVSIGIGALSFGGKLAVDAAVGIATSFGVSEALIGLTIVAVGTSLPELAASAVAAYKNKADIAVGNIVGSNIFNIFWILGISAVIKPLPFSPETNLDLGTVVLSTVLLFILIHNGNLRRRIFLWWKQDHDYVIRRTEGIVLLSCYILYLGLIIWREIA